MKKRKKARVREEVRAHIKLSLNCPLVGKSQGRGAKMTPHLLLGDNCPHPNLPQDNVRSLPHYQNYTNGNEIRAHP